MAEVFLNNVTGELAASVGSADTAIQLVPGHTFFDPGTNWYRATLFVTTVIDGRVVEQNHEIVKVTGLSADTLTVVRGHEGTTAKSFPTGAFVQHRFTAGAFDEHGHEISDVVGLQSGMDAKVDDSQLGTGANQIPVRDVNGAVPGDITGNAPTASRWSTPRTITLNGDVSGSAQIDGSGNVSLSVTVTDDQHNHIINNIDGLQVALDGKLGVGQTAADSDLLNGVPGSGYVLTNGSHNMTGKLTVVKDNAPDVNHYTGHIEIITDDGSIPSMGWHRRGYTAAMLYHESNGLVLSGPHQTDPANLKVTGDTIVEGNLSVSGTSNVGINKNAATLLWTGAASAVSIPDDPGVYYVAQYSPSRTWYVIIMPGASPPHAGTSTSSTYVGAADSWAWHDGTAFRVTSGVINVIRKWV